jgi:hypothetical protein
MFNMLTSKRQYEEDIKFVGFGTTPAKPEGTNTLMDDPAISAVKRYTHASFGLAFRVTHEAADDDLYGQINQLPADLANSNIELIEQAGANFFINALAGTELGYDGAAIFANSHPRLGGGLAYDNLDSVAFSITGLQTMTNYFEGALSDRDRHMNLRPSTIIIPFQLRYTAREIFNTAKKPFTADNEINSLLDEDLSFMINHYLTSATNWFVLPDKSKKKGLWPNFFWREKPSYKAGDDFLSGDMLNKTFLRFSLGATEPRGLWASNA